MSERPPTWFSGALADDPEFHAVEHAGARLNYLCWGDPANPGLVLIHGGAAHAHWWSFIAPQFIATRTAQYYVVAPDLSGHGDSERRPHYSADMWGDEILAVIKHSRMQGPVTVVGHSMGGHVAINVAARYGDELEGAIVIDSPIRRPDPESDAGHRGQAFRTPGTYPDLETAKEHFHLIPPQPVLNPFITDFIAERSVRQVDGGWTWKFDPMVFVNREPSNAAESLAKIRCRLAVIHGQLSDLVPVEMQEYIEELTGRTAPLVEVPQAYHHIPLDQPLALVATIRAIVGGWAHSLPVPHPTDDSTPAGGSV